MTSVFYMAWVDPWVGGGRGHRCRLKARRVIEAGESFQDATAWYQEMSGGEHSFGVTLSEAVSIVNGNAGSGPEKLDLNRH